MEPSASSNPKRKPRLLDLFCGAGGAAMGYARAGFEVVGVDVKPQPNYPFTFHQADAMSVTGPIMSRPVDLWHFDAIHASPPCHDYSTATGRSRKSKGKHGTAWMLPATRELLVASGLPYVIENVEGARHHMIDPIKLCGSSFGLDLRRHRYFESPALAGFAGLACAHAWQTPRFRSLDSRAKSLASVIGVHGHLNYPGEFELRKKAMGIDWMTNAELCQAIPPAYTEWVGTRLLAAIEGRVVAA